jgi:hypothetical protein
MNVLYLETQFLEFLNVLCNWTSLLKIYQLTKECIALNIPIMCYQFIHKNGPRDNRILFSFTKSLALDKLINL